MAGATIIAIQCLLVLLASCAWGASNAPPTLHFPLFRRGGPFAPNRTADLDFLKDQLAAAEARFNLTQREVRGNKIVRAPNAKNAGGAESAKLIGEIGRLGNWVATFNIGGARQPIQTDLDMLTGDFILTSTSSPLGTKFDEFFSETYSWSQDHPFPYCTLPKDSLFLPSLKEEVPVSFPHCKPPKQSLETLGPSGGILGLAPSHSLKQIKSDSLIKQLLDNGMIEHEVFSVTLVNGGEGLLSIGGTVAESMAMIDEKIERFLGRSPPVSGAMQVEDPEQDAADLANGAPKGLVPDRNQQPKQAGLGNTPGGGAGLKKRNSAEKEEEELPSKEQRRLRKGLEEPTQPHELLKRGRKQQKPVEQKTMPSWKDNWKWSPIEGADGWWQTLMRGVWTDGVKVLKNQPCVIDLSTPFLLAPPQAAKQFYASISGSHRLPPPYQSFYAFPCNNPPFVHVEFGGWRFPTMRGMKSYESSAGPNGKFSLGKVTEESGYCVGAVVETKMGVGDMAPIKKGHSRKEDTLRGLGSLESGMLAGNGMRDVWVLGEPLFRGLGVVFDLKQKKVGFRTY